MSKIAMVGPYAFNVKDEFLARLKPGNELIEVKDDTEYEKLADADYIVLRTYKMPGAEIDKLQKCKLIHRWGVGYDSVDIRAAGEKGIAVAVTSGVNAEAVAELAVAHMLSLYRHVPTMNSMLKNGQWERKAFIDRSFMISGKTVGLMGCGNIGRLVAKKVQAFGAKVIYYDVFRLPEEAERELGLTFASQDELLANADIVSLHMPANDSTKGMVDLAFLRRMKPSAILINTARGAIVNEADLIRALQEGIIAGAGLDSYEQEPIAPDNPLLKLENVVLTPHVGGNTLDVGNAMVERILDNIRRVESDEPLRKADLVNAQFLVK